MIENLAIAFYPVDNSQHFELSVLSQSQEGGMEAYLVDVTSKATGRISPTKPLLAELCTQGQRTSNNLSSSIRDTSAPASTPLPTSSVGAPALTSQQAIDLASEQMNRGVPRL